MRMEENNPGFRREGRGREGGREGKKDGWMEGCCCDVSDEAEDLEYLYVTGRSPWHTGE